MVLYLDLLGCQSRLGSQLEGLFHFQAYFVILGLGGDSLGVSVVGA